MHQTEVSGYGIDFIGLADDVANVFFTGIIFDAGAPSVVSDLLCGDIEFLVSVDIIAGDSFASLESKGLALYEIQYTDFVGFADLLNLAGEPFVDALYGRAVDYNHFNDVLLVVTLHYGSENKGLALGNCISLDSYGVAGLNFIIAGYELFGVNGNSSIAQAVGVAGRDREC